MANGLFNSLAVSYGIVDIQLISMMFYPHDLHADLIKYILSFSVYDPSLVDNWKEIYLNYFKGNDHRPNGIVNDTGLPFYVLLSLLLNILAFATTPSFVVIVFYLFIATTIPLVIQYITKDIKKTLILSLFVFLSYITFFILTRGHVFSYISSILIILFSSSFLLETKTKISIQILVFTILVIARPNAIIFGALFFSYGFKNGLKYLVISLSVITLEWLFIVELIQLKIKNYTALSFFTEFSVYYANKYVYTSAGSWFNNSLFGGLRWVLTLLSVDLSEYQAKLLNYFSILTSLSLMFISLVLFLFKRINVFYFLYIISSLYVLASSVFTTYHLLFFYCFLLLISTKSNFGNKYADLVIVIASVIVLSPKNYFFNNAVSVESFINPTILFLSTLYVFVKTAEFKK